MRQHDEAIEAKEKGNENEMIVFLNTRLARVFKRTTEVATFQALRDRAENYKLRWCPYGVLFLTAGVDTQDNRLAGAILRLG